MRASQATLVLENLPLLLQQPCRQQHHGSGPPPYILFYFFSADHLPQACLYKYNGHTFGRVDHHHQGVGSFIGNTNTVWLFLRSNWEYAYHYHLIIYVNKAMCSPHVCTNNNNNNNTTTKTTITITCVCVVCINNNLFVCLFVCYVTWYCYCLCLYIRWLLFMHTTQMIMICILPVRAKEQPSSLPCLPLQL